ERRVPEATDQEGRQCSDENGPQIQRVQVHDFRSLRLVLGWGGERFIPVDGALAEALMQHGEQLRIAGGKIFIGAVPLWTVFPSGLGETDDGGVATRLELKDGTGTVGADVRELIGSKGREHDFLLRDEADDGAAAGAAIGKM